MKKLMCDLVYIYYNKCLIANLTSFIVPTSPEKCCENIYECYKE